MEKDGQRKGVTKRRRIPIDLGWSHSWGERGAPGLPTFPHPPVGTFHPLFTLPRPPVAFFLAPQEGELFLHRTPKIFS